MKKIVIAIVLLFLMSTVSYAGLFRSDNSNQNNTTRVLDYSSNHSGGTTNESTGGFFRDSSADDPGDRPGNGDGIGQEAPISNGIHTLAVCCLVYGLVKVSNKKRK